MEREPKFGVSRLRDLWVVHAGPETLGVVLHVFLAERPAQALSDALNQTFDLQMNLAAEEAARQ